MDLQEPSKSMSMDDTDAPKQKYIPKQFDIDKLMSIKDKELRDLLINLMTCNSMFREETITTLESYGLIIDQREGNINRLLND